MSNLKDVRPKVQTITLRDGVQRELRFTLNAMAELEDKYGSVDTAFEKLENGSFKTIRFILWAGLIDNDPTLTEQKVGSLIDMNDLGELMKTLTASMNADMPEPEAVPAGLSVEDPNA